MSERTNNLKEFSGQLDSGDGNLLSNSKETPERFEPKNVILGPQPVDLTPMSESEKLEIEEYLAKLKGSKPETPEVKELTIGEIHIESITKGYDHGDEEIAFGEGAKWAKSLSDEYWKQEIAKKGQEIAELNKVIDNYISLVDNAAVEIKEKNLRIAELERKLEEKENLKQKRDPISKYRI